MLAIKWQEKKKTFAGAALGVDYVALTRNKQLLRLFHCFDDGLNAFLDKLSFLVLVQFHSAVISLIDSESAALLRNISNMLCGPV